MGREILFIWFTLIYIMYRRNFCGQIYIFSIQTVTIFRISIAILKISINSYYCICERDFQFWISFKIWTLDIWYLNIAFASTIAIAGKWHSKFYGVSMKIEGLWNRNRNRNQQPIRLIMVHISIGLRQLVYIYLSMAIYSNAKQNIC